MLFTVINMRFLFIFIPYKLNFKKTYNILYVGDVKLTNLETMDKAVSFTMGAYMTAYNRYVEDGSITYGDLERQAIEYSALALYKVLKAPYGMCSDYTRKDNLRYDMANLGGDSIKTELLKNIVNVAIYHKMHDTVFGNLIGEGISSNMSSEQVAVVMFNNMTIHGAQKGYELLNDPNILLNACRVFADHRREGKKEILDNIAVTNSAAVYVNNEIDTYYARYGDMPKKGDTTVLDNSEYSGYGGK